jgi:hypothetical protein
MRRGLRLAAARELFAYRGNLIIRDWKHSILRGRWGESWKYAMAVGWFLRCGLSDPDFFVTVCKEILPARAAGKRLGPA